MERNLELALYGQSILWGILNLATIIICIILVYKKRSTPFILMLIGSIFSLIIQIANPIVMVLLSTSLTESILSINLVLQMLSLISQIIFIIGLGMFALKFPKRAST